MIDGKIVSLSITSSKRLAMLERVLRAFSVFCEDLHVIDNIIFFDDSSTEEEKKKMEIMLNVLFPAQNKIIQHFYSDSFNDAYRHSRILNAWREKLIETNTEYCFHLEDDYLFVDFFDLETGIKVLDLKDDCGYVGYFQSYKKFPKEHQPFVIEVNKVKFWEWIYKSDIPLNEHLFLDEAGAIQTLNGNGYWMMYINWPHFSLRPGIHNVQKLLSIGEFSTSYDTNTMRTELEFSIRWAKKWKTYCHEKFMVVNLAWDESQSSYTLNNSN
jgi:hypothetical protein